MPGLQERIGLHLSDVRRLLGLSSRSAVPELYCPFLPRIHRLAPEVQESSVTWARDMGLVRDGAQLQRLRQAKIAGLACRAYPEARRTPLQLAADWTTLFCLLDDRTETIREPEVLRAYLAKLLDHFHGSARPSDDGIARAFEDIGERLRAEAPPRWVDRFASQLQALFAGFDAEVRNRSRDIIPPLAEYLKVREITVGVRVELELAELTDGVKVPPHVRAHPVFDALIARACNIIGWANDIYTYRKEIDDGDVHNLVVVAMQEHGSTFDEAVDWAVQLHNDETHALELALESLPRFDPVADEELAAHASALTSWVRGHLDWAHETGRYMTADGAPPSSQRWYPEMVSSRRGSFLPPQGVKGDE